MTIKMRMTKKLREYLQNRDFYNTFEIANTIADYKEGKHEDNRQIPDEIWDLAIEYINQEEMVLEDEERTRKWDENYCDECGQIHAFNDLDTKYSVSITL